MLWSIDSCQIRSLVSHECIAGSGVQLSEETGCFKFSTDQLLAFN